MVKCIFEGCSTRAYFNKKGEIKAIHCGKHKNNGEINIKTIYCKEKDCNKYALYTSKDKKIAEYCKEHSKEGMINIKTNVCKCGINATFGFENDTRPSCCFSCKEEGMINIKDNKCDFIDEYGNKCKIRANYGKEGEKKCRCVKHKTDEMIDVSHKKCEFKGCKTRPTFGIEKATHCNEHKEKEMKNIIGKKCASALCDVIIHNKFKGYCYRCYCYIYPNSIPAKNFKTKELEVLKFIKKNFSEYNWIDGKEIAGGNSKKRPDIFWQGDRFAIIIEIDELQHNNYICENKRMMELSNDVNGKPLIFIRFNPDAFIDKNKNKINSPWGYTEKKGLLKIINEDEWNNRLKILKKTVKYWLENGTTKTLEIVYLFYDCNKIFKNTIISSENVENNNNEENYNDENLKSIK